jgi:ABC-type uncharacterized transport system substrate-binding protein
VQALPRSSPRQGLETAAVGVRGSPSSCSNGIAVKAGLVARLNAPGGNITGVSTISTALAAKSSTGVRTAKRLEPLHQLASKTRSVGILVDPTRDASDTEKTEPQEAANALDLQLMFLNASTEHAIDAAFATLVRLARVCRSILL